MIADFACCPAHQGKLMINVRKVFQAIACAVFFAATQTAAADEMQPIGAFAIDKAEVTIGAFAAFVAETGMVTKAERDSGGLVYGNGWERKSGWNWRSPYGQPGRAKEPAVHVTFDEAEAYCRWAGKRLPTEAEWIKAAYNETRLNPPPPFTRGEVYQYPTGATPKGANCLEDCGIGVGINYSAVLQRGAGHAEVGMTLPGVNGLYDMGANVWEWVDIQQDDHKGTRGGSWWYGAAQMTTGYRATKPRDMAVVYIGFRCAKSIE